MEKLIEIHSQKTRTALEGTFLDIAFFRTQLDTYAKTIAQLPDVDMVKRYETGMQELASSHQSQIRVTEQVLSTFDVWDSRLSALRSRVHELDARLDTLRDFTANEMRKVEPTMTEVAERARAYIDGEISDLRSQLHAPPVQLAPRSDPQLTTLAAEVGQLRFARSQDMSRFDALCGRIGVLQNAWEVERCFRRKVDIFLVAV